MAALVSALLWAAAAVTAAAEVYPFQNTSLSWKERVDDLVGRLTLEEIQTQMGRGGVGLRGGPAPPIERLGIGPYSWNTECLRGDAGAGNATSFPQAIGLAAAWSPDLIFRVAQATSMEVRAKYNSYVRMKQYGDHKGVSCFSPVINLIRDPRWGRSQETYGEDPILSAILVKQFVQGLQGNDSRFIRANAGCKHFDVHGGPENIPVSRFSFNSKVSEQDWRMTFLPAFRSCVKAGTYSLMCSFNRINGVPSCANKQLLTDILRGEWGFQGYVISDQGAVELVMTAHHYTNSSVDTVAACVSAGLNLELSNDLTKPAYFYMLDAIKAGKLTETTVREAVKPLFYTRMRLGEFDPPATNPYSSLNLSIIQSPAHRNLSLEAAMKSFVLLKNLDNFLPLQKKFGTVGVVGPMADNKTQQFGDYSPTMDPSLTSTPLQHMDQLASKVQYGAGCDDNKCQNYSQQQVQNAVKGADLVVVCLGTGQEVEAEGNDRPDLELPGNQLKLLQDAVTSGNGAPVILLLFNAGPLNVTWADQRSEVKAILECFFPAQATGEAIINVLRNSVSGANPGGRLPSTWPMFADQVPPMVDYSMKGRTYRYFEGDPLYPFGYGLSYTRFSYVLMDFLSDIKAGEDLVGGVMIQNIGPLDGDEVFQVYIAWNNVSSVPVPRLQLADFQRVTLAKGQSQQFQFTVPAETMAVWVEGKGWTVFEGAMTLYVGGQQPLTKRKVPSDVLRGTFNIQGTKFLGRF